MKTMHTLALCVTARAPGRRLLRWSALSLLLSACTLAGARDHVDASEVAAEPGAGASAPAAGEGAGAALLNSLGSLVSKVKSVLPEASPSDPANPAGAAPQGLASGQPAPTAPIAFNIIDIDSWSKTSVVVLDPQCSTMVQPFGLSDNMASLAILAAKLKVNSLLAQFAPAGTQPGPGSTKIPSPTSSSSPHATSTGSPWRPNSPLAGPC